MAQNKMKEVAKLLGVELEEEFKIKGSTTKYKLSKNGLMFWSDYHQDWFNLSKLEQLLIGYCEIIKLPKPILDAKEKEYLSAVIRPFKKHIVNIRKIEYYGYEFIEILIYDTSEGPSCETISFPYFKKNSMYKGMQVGKEYTLEELGLQV